MKTSEILGAMLQDWRDQYPTSSARLRPDGLRRLGEQLGLEPEDAETLVRSVAIPTCVWNVEDAIAFALLVGATLANRRRDALDLDEKLGL